LLCIC